MERPAPPPPPPARHVPTPTPVHFAAPPDSDADGQDAPPETQAPDVETAEDAEPAPPPVVEQPPVHVPEYDEDESQFDAAPPFRRRRNWLKVWTWAGGIFALVAVGTIGAVTYWGMPDWVPFAQATFDKAQPDLTLDFPPDQQERRELANGTEYFGVSGTITNTGSSARRVPPILIVLRDERERIVYSWEVVPPQRSLAPGESVNVNEAVTDVPRAARVAEIGWKPS